MTTSHGSPCQEPTSHAEYRVLVVDDDRGCRESLANLLACEGLLTLVVDSGRLALDHIRASTPQAGWEDSSTPGAELPKDPLGDRASRGGVDRTRRRQHEIDFLVLDYNMPDLSGLEVLRRIRRHRITLPSIMVTGEFSSDLENSVLEEGGFALVAKPIQLDPFRELVWELIHTRLNV